MIGEAGPPTRPGALSAGFLEKLLLGLRQQLALARQSAGQLRSQYFNGVSDYIDVLNALTEQQETERDLLNGRLSLITARLSLYRALSGGFETRRERDMLEPNRKMNDNLRDE